MISTKAAVIHAPGMPYKIETLKLPELDKGEVLVKMAYAGICHSDENVHSGARTHAMPCVTGHEGAGTIEDIGSGVSNLKKGDHVILNWQPYCSECFHCRNGQTYLCLAYPERVTKDEARFFTDDGRLVFSYSHLGCFSERIVARQECCVPVDKKFPLDIAALIGCAVTTGVGAVVNTAKVKPGETVAIFGMGGVGLCASAGAKYAKAKMIIAVDRLAGKKDLSLAFGATHFVEAKDNVVSEIRKITEGLGVDYAFDAVGNPKVSEQCFAAARNGGTAVIAGLPHYDDRVSIRTWELVGCEKKVSGSLYGSADAAKFFPFLAGLHSSGKIDLTRLISKKYKLDEINEGFAALCRGENARGVIEF